MKVAIVGAGAAGCFCAVNLKRMMPEAEITVFERGRRPMAKLAITGGGRCNLTNTFRDITHLQQAYPRGWRLMQRLFRHLSPETTCAWWEHEGVSLVTQEDQCIFPRSQDAMQIVNTLLHLINIQGIHLVTSTPVAEIATDATGYYIIANGEKENYDAVAVTTGGSPRPSGLSFLSPLAVEVIPPVPSLYALNINDEHLHSLTGTVVEDCHVSIAGSKFQANGPLLITHFGMSGPAILKLSSYAAPFLAEQQYHVRLSVNWMEGRNEEEVRNHIKPYLQENKQMANLHPQHLTARHWAYLLGKAGIACTHRWNALNRKEQNRLVSILTADTYATVGRCHYKGEFVTCGGVSLSNINTQTLALKSYPSVYLAGEALDIDGITGGFNLQAAWTTAYVVAESIAKSNNF